MGLIPVSGRSPAGGHGNPRQLFLSGESHGQGSLAGYSPWGCKESDMTERLIHTHTHTHSYSIYSYYKILHIFSVWYNIPLWFIHFVHNSLHLLGSDPSISPPPYPLPIGNPQFVLQICESDSSFYSLVHCIFQIPHIQYLFFSV